MFSPMSIVMTFPCCRIFMTAGVPLYDDVCTCPVLPAAVTPASTKSAIES